eukprot:364169-Chlamydomonas_euryale.AAC.9
MLARLLRDACSLHSARLQRCTVLVCNAAFLLRCVLSKVRCLVSRASNTAYLPSGWPYCCWLAAIRARAACRCQVKAGTLRRQVTWFVRLADMPVQRAETQSVPAHAS